MQPLELAKKYIAAFFGSEPLASLENILADNLIFEGPFYKFSSAKDYIKSLYENPPTESKYVLIAEYENNNSACLIYNFIKPGVEALMAQHFEVSKGKISKIRLIFDSGEFT